MDSPYFRVIIKRLIPVKGKMELNSLYISGSIPVIRRKTPHFSAFIPNSRNVSVYFSLFASSFIFKRNSSVYFLGISLKRQQRETILRKEPNQITA